MVHSELAAILASMAGAVDDQAFMQLLDELNAALDEVAVGHLTSATIFSHPQVDGARIFAIAAHGAHGAVRAGSNLPYASHCAEVVSLLACVSENPDLLAAAWLHDVIEDTSVTRDLVCHVFGNATAQFTWTVTCENPGFARRDRIALFRAKLAAASDEEQTLKVCDIISNARRARTNKPAFAPRYLLEKKADLQVLTRANAMLLSVAGRIIDSELWACQK